MTITNWELSPERAVIINDALVSDQTYAPLIFTTKGRCLPHLQIIMSGKGAALPLQALWARCMNGLIVKDVVELAEIAGPIVADAYQQVRGKFAEDECAVFIFGWSCERGRIVGYAFRFENAFACEALTDGRELIPALRGPAPEGWEGVVRQQQAEDRALPMADRDNIGGWIIVQSLIRVPGEDRALIQIETSAPMAHHAEDALLLAEQFERLPPTLQRWERCEPWLAPALAYDPCGRTIEDIRGRYQVGAYILLEGARSAMLLEGTNLGGNQCLHAYLAGGDLEEITNSLRPRMEALAGRVGAKAIILTGRKGWYRAWAPFGYRLGVRTSAKNFITIKELDVNRPEAA